MYTRADFGCFRYICVTCTFLLLTEFTYDPLRLTIRYVITVGIVYSFILARRIYFLF